VNQASSVEPDVLAQGQVVPILRVGPRHRGRCDRLEATFRVQLPTSLPPKLTGVGIFEGVETQLISDYPTNWVLRHMQPREIGNRVRNGSGVLLTTAG
jgi:hypothetical protein